MVLVRKTIRFYSYIYQNQGEEVLIDTYSNSISLTISYAQYRIYFLLLQYAIYDQTSYKLLFKNGRYLIKFFYSNYYQNFFSIKSLTLYQRIYLLYKISKRVRSYDNFFSPYIHPHNIMFDDKADIKIIAFRFNISVSEMTENADYNLFLIKSLIIYGFRLNIKFDYLVNGYLHIIQKNKIEKLIYNSKTLDQIIVILAEFYEINRFKYFNRHIIIHKRTLNRYILVSKLLFLFLLIFTMSLILIITQ